MKITAIQWNLGELDTNCIHSFMFSICLCTSSLVWYAGNELVVDTLSTDRRVGSFQVLQDFVLYRCRCPKRINCQRGSQDGIFHEQNEKIPSEISVLSLPTASERAKRNDFLQSNKKMSKKNEAGRNAIHICQSRCKCSVCSVCMG